MRRSSNSATTLKHVLQLILYFLSCYKGAGSLLCGILNLLHMILVSILFTSLGTQAPFIMLLLFFFFFFLGFGVFLFVPNISHQKFDVLIFLSQAHSVIWFPSQCRLAWMLPIATTFSFHRQNTPEFTVWMVSYLFLHYAFLKAR